MQHTDQGTHIVKICAIIILHQCHINRLYFFNEKNSFKNITEIMINFSVCSVYVEQTKERICFTWKYVKNHISNNM